MRRKPSLAGYVITELHDCHWESNGLLDMRRNPRVFHELFHIVNSDTVIVPKWERLSYWSGETAQVQVAIAHGAGPVLEDCHLEIALGEETKRLPLPRIEAPAVLDLGSIDITIPDYGEPALRRIAFELRAPDGKLVAQNHLDVAIHPERAVPVHSRQLVWSDDEDLRERFAALGYGRARALDECDAHRVAQPHETAIADQVRQGASLLLLPEEEIGPLSVLPALAECQGPIARRDALARRLGVVLLVAAAEREHFARFPCGPLLDETMDRVLPDLVIAGCNLLDFQARVFAGLVVGWIHKPVALGVERTYGRGRLVATTFRLLQDEPLADPTATMLTDSLVQLALEARAPTARRGRARGGSRGLIYSAANCSASSLPARRRLRRRPASSASARCASAVACNSSSRCVSRKASSMGRHATSRRAARRARSGSHKSHRRPIRPANAIRACRESDKGRRRRPARPLEQHLAFRRPPSRSHGPRMSPTWLVSVIIRSPP